MLTLKKFLQQDTPTPRPFLQERVWSSMEKTYHHSGRSILAVWRNVLTGSIVTVCLGVIIVSHVMTQQKLHTQVSSLDKDLDTLEQEVTNDPVITEALNQAL